MSFRVFQRQLWDIVGDLGKPYWKAISEEASQSLHEAVTKRLDGIYVDRTFHWTLAQKEDFVAAAEMLKAKFTETTTERVVSLAGVLGTQVSLRPTAVWVDGKIYRRKLMGLWSYQPAPNMDMRWAVEVTPFGRVVAGAYFGFVTGPERKRFEMDAPSEYLAEKGMREICEKVFRVTLLS